MNAISTQMGRHHRPVKKSLAASTLPARPPRRCPTSMLAPYKASLLERWQAGGRSPRARYREMHAPGCAGQYSIVADSVSRLRPPPGRITRRRTSGAPATIVALDKPLPPSRAPWFVMRRAATLHNAEKHQRVRLQAQAGEIAEAITWTQAFAALVRQRQPRQLEPGLERATASGLQAFQRFAKGLRVDDAAVKAGVTLSWSTGPVEGQINRLTMLKRQLSGRAGFGLLRQRVLHPI
jgi:transposase